MSSDRVLMMIAGEYVDPEAAKADLRDVQALHDAGEIGRLDATLVTKTPEGRVEVLDEAHAAAEGGGSAANAMRRIFGMLSGVRGQIKRAGATLDPGEASLVLLAEVGPGLDVARVVGRSDRHMERVASGGAEELE